MQVLLVCLVILFWIALIIASTIVIVRVNPNRFLWAGAIAIDSAIATFASAFVGGTPFPEPIWLSPIIAAVLFFCSALLWTYLNPALRGTTWSAMIENSIQQGELIRAKKRR